EGKWSGNYTLIIDPNSSPHTCPTIMNISSILNSKFLKLKYTWEFETTPHEGMILLTFNTKRKLIVTNWIDSWHMGTDIMTCNGYINGNMISFTGQYAASEGPDWRWRTEINLINNEEFEFKMYNIHPQNIEDLAVCVRYLRVKN
ncbi:MAG: DUF1579 domain-containing protein, partial [Candidatus Heimdallarchaeota archaeon]|nr:DUF1579 domain-containing protein [Candidatus Heimdallarchaeota archaeon]